MNKVLITAIILVFISLSAYTLKQYEKFQWQMRGYVINCSVFDFQMKLLKNVPGTMCVFLKNGDVVRYFDKEMTGDAKKVEINLSNHFGKIIWSKPFSAHHSMKADRTESRLYFLSTDKKKYHEKWTKFDRVVALDIKTGQEISSWSFYSLHSEMETLLGGPLKQDDYDGEVGVTAEVSHFNSINLVPFNLSKETEIIVNTGRGLELFFTKDLKYTGKFMVNSKWMADSHDAQVTEDGDLLIYRNFGEEHPGSFLEIRSMNDNKILWSYTGTVPGKTFSADLFGSVQLFNDGSFLYSDMKNGGHFTTINNDGKVINEFNYPEVDPRTKLPLRFHTVRRLEYGEMSDDIQELMRKDIEKNFMGKLFLHLLRLKSQLHLW